jgi:PIN domain nuclease of toxin-antitoxin system
MLDAAEVFVSAVSIWEIAIKAKLGKLEGDPRYAAFFSNSQLKSLDLFCFSRQITPAPLSAASPLRNDRPFNRFIKLPHNIH